MRILFGSEAAGDAAEQRNSSASLSDHQTSSALTASRAVVTDFGRGAAEEARSGEHGRGGDEVESLGGLRQRWTESEIGQAAAREEREWWDWCTCHAVTGFEP